MSQSIEELVKYRIARSKETLEEANLLANGDIGMPLRTVCIIPAIIWLLPYY